jgi:hypothetical protein
MEKKMIKKINLINDLYWEWERMSTSGQETLDKLAKEFGMATYKEQLEIAKLQEVADENKWENLSPNDRLDFIMYDKTGNLPIDYIEAHNGGILFYSKDKKVAWYRTAEMIAYLFRKRGLMTQLGKSSSMDFASEYGFKNDTDAILLFDKGLLKHEKENARLNVFNPVI